MILQRPLVQSYLELFALTGVLVAQPLFDLLGRNAGLFILWDLSRWQFVVFCVIIVAAPATALWAVEVLASLISARVRSIVHGVLLGLLSVGIAIVVLKKLTELGRGALVVGAIVLAAGVVALLIRFEILRAWLRVLAVAPILFALVFAGISPATRVAFNRSVDIADAQAGQPARVVMVVLDELPLTSLLDGKGRVDAQLYPNLAKFAAGSTWYRNDTTVAPFTDAAVPAILTGREPSNQDRLPYVSDYPENLFTLLGGQYSMNVHEVVTRLCPESLCARPRELVTGAHPGLTGALRDATSIWRDFASPTRTASFAIDTQIAVDLKPIATADEFVSSLEPAAEPRLDFLHLLMPHFPWHYLPDGRDYATLGAVPNGLVDQRWANGWVGTLARQRHLLQARATDMVVGRIVERLREIDAYEDSMIVVTADHGASFAADRPFRGVHEDTYADVMWTPLFVKYPRQARGEIDDRPAESIDIVPTIADVLDVDVPWQLDGRSLRQSPRAEGPRRLLDWDRNAVQPRGGERYVTFDGAAGFARVLRARAAPPDADVDLRLYRMGPFGRLVGKPVGERVGTPTGLVAKIDAPLKYQVVDPSAPAVPWAQIHGTIRLPAGRRLAFAVNGVVVGVYETFGSKARTDFWGMIPPALLRPGRNALALYTLEGSPTAPQLRPVGLR
jgi:hypothetical protein